MATVRTPCGQVSETQKPVNRLLLDSLQNSPQDSPASKTFSIDHNKKLDDINSILMDTCRLTKHSIILLNQTRNMKGELKSGLADNLKNIQKRIGKALEFNKKDGKVGNEDRKTKDLGVQCDREVKGGSCGCDCKALIQEMQEWITDILTRLGAQLKAEMRSQLDSQTVRVEEVGMARAKHIIEETKNNVNSAIEEREARASAESQTATYAEVARGGGQTPPPAAPASVAGKRQPKPKTLHSLVVTDKENFMSTTDIVSEVGKIIEPTKEGIKIDRIRRAKGRKVIIGFSDRTERDKIKEKIENSESQFNVETIANKDPQVVLYGVLKSTTDDDIFYAIRNQNKHLQPVPPPGVVYKFEVKYRRRGKDNETEHVVCTLSPQLWQTFTAAGYVYIGMQRVRVADQSPLIQCSRCLGYGHGRRHCNNESEPEKCSHCGGDHRKFECGKLDERPHCINCEKDGCKDTKHDAFGAECPVRMRWDAIARATVAYDPDDQ